MQPHLFPLAPTFSGSDFQAERDQVRLGAQILRVLAVMQDGAWHSVEDIQARIWTVDGIRDPENSIQAQIRNLKKVAHGAHDIERRRTDGHYQWRLHRAEVGQ